MERKSLITNMAAVALLSAGAGSLEPGMYDALPKRRARQKKEFTHFDQQRIDKAEEKRARKAAKIARDND